ncbi:type 4b pilus protein PilO2 [Massilia violaceinigra]|uniref:Type 4b pilus protein PilO2 n=1 Tax=Massilia violaceinigra TaxID=2045208 RepID=A0ABY4A4E7_9BURK|nr:type 4b pilus protein PilO2 [Massilia violaceinigra]UOD29658.1 type 4b pilus protein PilO2 [Massilia violaceinigra]
MTGPVIQLGRHKFVCGLFWQSLSRPRELAREAADLARKIDCDMAVLRREYSTAQAGFAHSGSGPRQALYSLAAAVASRLARDGAHYDGENQPVHNWLAAFRLPDGNWTYFAVRDANFLPNGDFAGTREEVFDRLHGDYGLGGWNLVIGDAELEHYGFHNFRERSIEEVLGEAGGGQIKVNKAWLLRPTAARISPRMMAAGAGVCALLALGAGLGWRHHQQRQQALRLAEAAALVRQAQPAAPKATPAPHPWAHSAGPTSVARACMAGLTQLTPGGWALSEYSCGAPEQRSTWTRNESTVAFLLARVPDAQVDIGGDTATLARPFKPGPGVDEALLPQQQLVAGLRSRLQLMNLNMQLARKEAPPAAPAPENGAASAASPDWNTYTYVIGPVGVSPLEVAAMLEMPGIRIEKMRYRAGIWSLEGVIYAK